MIRERRHLGSTLYTSCIELRAPNQRVACAPYSTPAHWRIRMIPDERINLRDLNIPNLS